MIERHEIEDLLAFALDSARVAGRSALASFGRSDLSIERKADATFVTDADRRGEEILRGRLADRCPEDGVIGEEFGVEEGTSGRAWTIDPIDGTFAFVHGVPTWCVLIALLEGGRSVLGVVHLPALGETVYAARGLGCTRVRGEDPPEPARVSGVAALGDALVLATDFGRLPGPDLGAAFARLRRAAGSLRTWGDGWGHALVATGRAEAMVDPRMAPWDSAPLQPIVEEAGGQFTTLAGDAVPTGGSAISTNGAVHREVLAVLSRTAP